MPRTKVVTVGLAAADREFLVKLTTSGTHPARMIMRARVLLELDENAGPVAHRAVSADRVGTSENTVRAVAKRFADADGHVLATIGRKPRETPPVAPVVTGQVEARLIALACSTPPEGYSRWSLRLLERHVTLAADLPELDHSTIGRVLKKTKLRPHLKKCWTIPPHANAEFAARMEDVLAVYARPHDPADRWCAWTRSPTSCWGRFATRSPPSPVMTRKRTASTSATAPARSSSGSNPYAAGTASTLNHTAPRSTGPARCSTCSLTTTPTPRPSCWSWTTSTPTASAPSTTPSHPPRRSRWHSGWRSTTPPGTAPGSTSPRSNCPP